ncbi:DUF1428 domain-containing protein [Pseudorhodobacter sp.]|uniref:DUF1428 domain-containing protein n=1 Tax=Pseudorhodobacter sp. TaxID=1934400 RepID=UPI002AFF7B29|nr:DUF1428 domain-containing protein [Pseudorhodobacter sp.]
MTYYEIFVVPVPRDKLDEYFAVSAQMVPMWKALGVGAVSVVETRPENVPTGKVTSFPLAVKCERGELPVFAFMTFRDRAHRDAVIETAMADPAMGALMRQVPMDARRMIFGGFTAEIEA